MKYINQLEYPHWLYVTRTDLDEEARQKGKTTTVRSSGCGVCSAVMVADRLLPNCQFDLSDSISLSYEVAANHSVGTDYVRYAPAFSQKLGLRYLPSNNIGDLRSCLRTGGAAVVLVNEKEPGEGLFTHGSHYIAVVNEEPDGRFAILDPSFKESKYEEPYRKGKVEIKNGVVLLCDGETLDHEVKKTRVGYHLFWRM